MRSPCGEPDSSYGAAMLTLRTTMALSRGELAHSVGVSRQAVGEWEAGRSYPKTEHLQALIALAVQKQAFAKDHEAREIHQLWKTAHQKVLLDEHWLSALLSGRCSPQPFIVPLPVQETPTGTRTTMGPDRGSYHDHQLTPLPSGSRVDWGDAPVMPPFYGREQELEHLSEWILQEHCRVVSLLGMGGIGKSALSVRLTSRLAEHFEVIIFRSLRDTPALEELLDDCLQVLSPKPLGLVPVNLEQRITRLLEHMRRMRVLLVLDNLESLLEPADTRGHLRPGFLGYEILLHRVVERGHQSCLLITSREKPSQLQLLEGRYSQIRSLRLAGLDRLACQQIFREKEIVGTEKDVEQLIEIYAGNPLALKIVAQTIIDLFGSQIGAFLAGRTVLFGSITALLDEHFARLSAIEQSVLCWLSIAREPMTLDELREMLVSPLPRIQLLEAVDGLRHRSLIEPGKRVGSFTLQSVVLEYVTALLVTEGSREIQQNQLHRLIQHGLSQARAKEYVQQTQERLLLSPLLTDLHSAYWDAAKVEEQLLSVLDELRELADTAQGYGPANLIALLQLLRGHLKGLDLSLLSIRSARLQDIQMQGAKLSGALIRDSCFAQAFSTTWAVTISLDGTLWAASSIQGKVSVWEEQCQTLRLVWQAHTDVVVALAFSPDGRTLVSGGMDDTLKLWDMNTGTLLWTGWQKCPLGLAFSPDGCLLASAGLDRTVRIWDPQNGMNLQTLCHPGDIFAVAFSPDGSLLASGGFDGRIRLWEKQKTAPAFCFKILSIQTTWVTDLAFAPDGRTLASTHWDRRVNLWEVGSLHLLSRLSALQSRYLAWSPDGHTLACYDDKTIWLWDVDQTRCRMALHGHIGEVYHLAFTPDSHYLFSSSADSTLRVWDVETAQCLHVIPGYAISLYDVDWSPDGTHLVSGSTNGLVTIWDLSEQTPPRVLRGHTWVVHGVGWSPDGRYLSSCGWDTTLRLWDLASFSCVQRFGDLSTPFLKLAWSPDGRLLAAGSFQRGMHVWNIATRSLHFVGQPLLTTFRQVAWSPDGTRLVGCSDDGHVYLWRGTDGTLLHQLSGHEGRVVDVVWSPDGKRLASCSSSEGMRDLFVWDALTGERLQTFAKYPGGSSALAWSRSCQRDQLVSGHGDGTLRWWDVETAECIGIRAAHQGTVQSLKVSPDGRRLVSCGNDGALMIWDLESTERLQTLRHDRPYERLNITGIRGLTEAEKSSLKALGAIENGGEEPSRRTQDLSE